MMSTHAFSRNDVIMKIRGQNDVKTHFNEKSRIFMNIHDSNHVFYSFIDKYWNYGEKYPLTCLVFPQNKKFYF